MTVLEYLISLGHKIQVTDGKLYDSNGRQIYVDNNGYYVSNDNNNKLYFKKDGQFNQVNTFKPTFFEKLRMGVTGSLNFSKNIDDPYIINNGYPKSGVASAAHMLNRKRQKQFLESNGYTEVTDGNYGLVKKAVGNHNFPIFQRRPDVISRDKLIAIGNVNMNDDVIKYVNDSTSVVVPDNWYGSPETALYSAGHHPSTLFWNPETGKYYQQSWDLNDYGGKHRSTNPMHLGDLLDWIGYPVVYKSGIQEVLPQYFPILDEYKQNYLNEHSQ